MDNKKRKRFVRSFPKELQAKLREQVPLWSKLQEDIRTGEVFPAIRNGEMHFYHKGGRLLAFSDRGFRTNVKYTLALHDGKPIEGDIHEADLHRIEPIPRFATAYGGMKQLCALYAGWEAAAVAGIYAKWSYANRNPDSKRDAPVVVVLDIEASLSADIRESAGDKQDRIDFVLLDTKKMTLLFVEAKLFANGAIRAKTGCRPKVVGQIENYRRQIAERRDEIIDAYRTYTESINSLFDLALPVPTDVIKEVPVLIVDFDSDQRDGRLMQNVECLHTIHKVCCLDIGKTEGVSESTLKSWFRKVERFAGRR